MPRANRYNLAGQVCHLTHRCHDRQFLLRFAKDRDGYRRRLWEAVRSVKASLLTCNITSHHVHLLTYADNPEQVAVLMQQAAGEFAREYNRRKGRSGAFGRDGTPTPSAGAEPPAGSGRRALAVPFPERSAHGAGSLRASAL
jgi:putative transposase